MATLGFLLLSLCAIGLNTLLAGNCIGHRLGSLDQISRVLPVAAHLALCLLVMALVPILLGSRWVRGRLKRNMSTNPMRFVAGVVLFWNLLILAGLWALVSDKLKDITGGKKPWLTQEITSLSLLLRESQGGVKGALRPRATFKAINHPFGKESSQAQSLGDFTEAGPIAASLRPLRGRVKHITFDPRSKTYFAVSDRTFGRIQPKTAVLEEIEVAPTLPRLGSPCGVTFDTRRRRILIASRTGERFLYALNLNPTKWEIVCSLGGFDVGAMAYGEASDSLYLVSRKQLIDKVRILNQHGGTTGTVVLSRKIPIFSNSPKRLQLKYSQGQLYFLVPPGSHPRLGATLYRVHPGTGTVTTMPFNRSGQPTSELWPGMGREPPPSTPLTDCCGEGSKPSNYRTPADLIDHQDHELHVISVASGLRTRLAELTAPSAGLDKGLQKPILVDRNTVRTAVDITVKRSEKPMIAVLASNSPVLWNMTIEKGANLDLVFLQGAQASQITGIGKETRVLRKSLTDYSAVAWELESNPAASFDGMIRDLRKKAGFREASFQGCRHGGSFVLPFCPDGQQARD